MKIVTIILCGGSGTRLWPISTPSKPKQFCRINFDQTFLEMAIERAEKFSDDVYCLAPEKYSQYIPTKMIVEPEPRDTAAAILHAAENVEDDPYLVIMPSDHVMDDISHHVKTATTKSSITLLGIKPSKPSTQYGYISHNNGKVCEFYEKPDSEKAQKFLQNGYLWNSGIFMCRKSELIDLFRRYTDMCGQKFHNRQKISFDYAIMEKMDDANILTFSGNWTDYGNFEEFEKGHYAHVVHEECDNVTIFSNVPVVVHGVDDLIIVNTEDGLLVKKRGKNSKHLVKKIIR